STKRTRKSSRLESGGLSATGERGVGLTADQRSPKPRVGVRIPPPLPKITMPAKELNDSKAPEPKGWLESVKEWPAITKNYVGELQLKMKRVTWPNRKQVESTTAIVILTVFAFAAYFKVVDSVLFRAISSVQNAFK